MSGPVRDVAEFLGTTPLFRGLERAVLDRLASLVRPLSVPAGEVLMHEGSAGDALYLVVVGRLRAFVEQSDGSDVAVGDIASGEMVGEMALLGDSPRTATVVAVRDSHLFRLDRDEFERFVHEHPEALFQVTRLLVDRLERRNRGAGPSAALQTVAVVVLGDRVDPLAFTSRLLDGMAGTVEAVMVDRSRVDGMFGPQAADAEPGSAMDAEVTRWLHGFESQRNVVVYVADDRPGAWTDRCIRQADRVLLVGTLDGLTLLDPIEIQLSAADGGAIRPHTDLVIVHDPAVGRPRGTVDVLAARSVARHHHVRAGNTADFRRLARVIDGRGVGLVLSGGGARGLAHFGIVRAMREAGVPIDHVGGASFGSVVAGFTALQWSEEQMLDTIQRLIIDRGSLLDPTVPLLAIARGAKLSTAIHEAFGEAEFEDLWTPFFCVSSDLTVGGLRAHRSGVVWKAVRASVAIPGVFPPVAADDGHVLVDGGVMDNLPVDVMRADPGVGHVIAVDLRARSEMPSEDLPTTGTYSGWQGLWRRLSPFAPSPETPKIVDVMLRATEMASGSGERDTDLTIRPSLAEFPLLDFSRMHEIVQAGYRSAAEALERHPLSVS